MSTRADYAGLDTFVWWMGVVEDINDPLKLGRLRVRILGWHNENKTSKGVPTESLPWAQVVQPITSPAMSGIGRSPTGILQGSWVIGFFLDGTSAQQPMVFGSFGGMQKPDKIEQAGNVPYNDLDKQRSTNNLMDYTKGFRDPQKTYPVEGRMNEPDTNRLARNENTDWTVVQKKEDTLVQSVQVALFGQWDEPPPPYSAQYPKNHVTESESGHVLEMDDTPGAERLHIYHKSGTFTEIHPDGGEVHKVLGNNWDITLGDDLVYINGISSTTVGKSMKIRVGENLDIEVDGEIRVLSKMGMTLETRGNFTHKILGTATIASEGPMLFVAPRIDLNPTGVSPTMIQTILSIIGLSTSAAVSGGVSGLGAFGGLGDFNLFRP